MRAYFNARDQQVEYSGPADQPIPADQVSEVRIGYFGPSDPRDPSAGLMWQAAELAIARANQEGGYQGKPFRLLSVWSQDPWGTGVAQLTRLVYEDRVWAIVGGVDGPTTHLAEQVVAKARLPLVSPVSTDKTVNLVNVPWMFSLAPGDDLIASALATQIEKTIAHELFVIVSANDHDSCLLTRELRKELAQLHLVPAFQFECRPGSERIDELIKQCLACQPKVVIAIADAKLSTHLVLGLRKAGFDGTIFGGPGFARTSFRRRTGNHAGPIVFPILTDEPKNASPNPLRALPRPAEPLPDDFDFTALQTYDAVSLTVAAIRQAGLSRAEIGRALRELSPCAGVSGRIQWDGLGSNQRRPTAETLGVPVHGLKP